MIPYGRQSISDADIQAVVEVLRSDWLTCGPAVERFEAALAEYCGARHVIAVSNGTAALHIAMLAAGIRAGDRVLTSPNTFLASANCAEYVGASADFADIEADTHNLDPRRLEAAWTPHTRAVVAVDFAGQPCDLPAIAAVARARGALVVEDAAHSLGSRFTQAGREHRVGSHPWADLTTFSFHPVKTITTGEGGAIATQDDELAARCRRLRSHGMRKNRPQEPWHYEMPEPGFNYRITDLQCALGAAQLGRIESFIQRRQAIVDEYNQAFRALDFLKTPAVSPANTRVSWHLYVVEFDFQRLGCSRAEVMARLAEKGVGTQVHYIPVHTQPYYARKYGYTEGKCPVAEAYYRSCLSLPLYPALSDADVRRVIDAVASVGERSN